MILGTGCLGERSLQGVAIRDALQRAGLEDALLVVGSGTVPAGLAGLRAPVVRVPLEEASLGATVASSVQANHLVVDLPADLGVDALCRCLFDLDRSTPGLSLSVSTPVEGPLATPEAVALVCEDLAARGLGYWHRPSAIHLVGGEEARWIDVLGEWMAGVSLDDVMNGEAGFPPGLGELDFADVARWHSRTLYTALDLGPVADVGLLRMTVEALAAVGIG